MQRRWRLRQMVGEMLVDQGFSKSELDNLSHLFWKLGRVDADGNRFGGPNDGAAL